MSSVSTDLFCEVLFLSHTWVLFLLVFGDKVMLFCLKKKKNQGFYSLVSILTSELPFLWMLKLPNIFLMPIFGILLVTVILQFPYRDCASYINKLKTFFSSRHPFRSWRQIKTPQANFADMFLKTFPLQTWIVLIINFSLILNELHLWFTWAAGTNFGS